MSHILSCGDIVPGCSAQMTGETEQDVLRQAAEHAKTAHGLATIDDATAMKVKAAIRTR